MKTFIFVMHTFHQFHLKFYLIKILIFSKKLKRVLKNTTKMEKTFVVGYLNSRIGCLSDILESDRYLDAEIDDNDIYDDEFSRDNNILKNRKNMDNIVDNNGRM